MQQPGTLVYSAKGMGDVDHTSDIFRELDWFCCLICRQGFSGGLKYSVSECGHISCANCLNNAGKDHYAYLPI